METRKPTQKSLANRKQPTKIQPAENKQPATEHPDEMGFPIVVLGASAGGLEAFEAFFNTTSAVSGMAFILIAHLDPTHISLLPELVQKRTKMQVHKIVDGTKVEPDNVYVIPPNNDLTILNGILQLMRQSRPRGVNLPIDIFFRSLARDQGANAICIILSGTGTDGTLGLKAIKGEVGMVMVQDEDSAKYDGMPRSAIATGLADYVLPPDQMFAQLLKYTRHSLQVAAPFKSSIEGNAANALQKIYILLRTQTDHDFSLYKKNTICRRIERRMAVNQIDDINEYVLYLKNSEREVNILFQELLIGVTNFFRDAEMFDTLSEKVLTKLLEEKPDGYTIRVWVAGCSSGEEAYSLAIILQECMSRIDRQFNVQIFATDIDEGAINSARAGIYPASIQADVSPERLKLHFTKEDDGQFRIKKSIRESLVFASHNVIKDPPFTKLDIMSCRNLLIYMGPELQKRLLPIFHYGLKRDGILFLGSSETIGQDGVEMFTTLDRKGKIFRRKQIAGIGHKMQDYPTTPARLEIEVPEVSGSIRRAEEISALQLVESILQQSKAPPCAVIDDACNVVYIHGRTGRYLEPAEGKISVNILEMARPGLKVVLTAAIRKVALNKEEICHRDLEVQCDEDIITVDLFVKPILEHSITRGLMMVIFEEKSPSASKSQKQNKSLEKKLSSKSPEDIERELLYARENLQITVEELEASNEELKSTNEELQSTNEELQSTNEEMETSKEELQSLNEESITVNAELQSHIDELSKANDDMKNLLDSTDIATLFLDKDLCIRRFTPGTTEIIPLSRADVGRPISNFSNTLLDTNLSEYGSKVLDDLAIRELEVKCLDGRIFAMRVRPYRTITNLIDGVVVTFEDISERKRSEQIVNETAYRYRIMFDLASDSIVMVNARTGGIKESNRNARERLGYSLEEFQQLAIQDIEAVENPREVLAHLAKLVSQRSGFFETRYRTKTAKILNVVVKVQAFTIDQENFLLFAWPPADERQAISD